MHQDKVPHCGTLSTNVDAPLISSHMSNLHFSRLLPKQPIRCTDVHATRHSSYATLTAIRCAACHSAYHAVALLCLLSPTMYYGLAGHPSGCWLPPCQELGCCRSSKDGTICVVLAATLAGRPKRQGDAASCCRGPATLTLSIPGVDAACIAPSTIAASSAGVPCWRCCP
jgi:hypothetical protein